VATSTLSPALQKLTTALSQQGLTSTEIAEVLWFATTIVQGDVIDVPSKPIDSSLVETSGINQKQLPSDLTADTFPYVAPEPLAELVPEPVNTLALPEHYRPIPVPDAAGIAAPLEIARSLRVLAKKAAVGQPRILDEEATVDRVAETGIWQPVLRPAEELWWDVALVFDKHPSLCLWQRFAADLHRILCRYGQFRDVRIWFLEPEGSASGNEVRFVSRRAVGHKPSELLTGDRRRLVVILSDCVGAGWHNGQIQALVALWGKTLPTVVFQVFPERLWSRTALARSITVEFQSKTANAPNITLKPTVLSIWDQSRLTAAQRSDAPYLPVVPIDPAALSRWASVLAGDRRPRTLGIVWDAPAASPPLARPVEPPTISDRLDTFILRASPLSRQLATLLTAAPVITLPIVRLIRRAMLPQASTVHFAEVFMSGLLKVSGSQTPNFENAERIAYELVDETVRERLRSGSGRDTQDVLNRVSLYVAQGLGKSVQEFRALLRTPSAGVGSAETQFLQAFATVTAKILRGIGIDFETISDRLIGLTSSPPPGKTWPPDLEELSVEIATVQVEEIVQFEFETAKIEKDSKNNTWVITKTTGTVWGYIETLSPLNIQTASLTPYAQAEQELDFLIEIPMIEIKGGTFTMGSSKDEPESDSDERPQHEVRLGDFWIGQTPITQAQWRVVANYPPVNPDVEFKANPSDVEGENNPVEQVNWYEAKEFCDRLSAATGKVYDLPTEAEWEYVCRAGTTTPFSFGAMITTELANYNGNYPYNNGPKGEDRNKTTPVGTFPANASGIYDMHGNVWEWCLDHWHDSYVDKPEELKQDGNAAWLYSDESKNRLLRGGSWGDSAKNCRSACRSLNAPVRRSNNYGFRVVCRASRTL